MEYRTLGRTGLSVSEIGFGTWGIGGIVRNAVAYGPTDDAQSRRVLRMALERGITFYDTAPLYGYGHSEELLGEAFRAVRDEVVIASKVGMVDSNARQDFSPEHLRTSVEGSLQRLQTDYLDLLQLHDPPIRLLEAGGEIFRTLEILQKEGKVRAYGISVRAPEDAFTAVQRFGFSCVQANLNLLDQRAVEGGLLDFCQREEVGLIARTPLCFGFLTGAYGEEEDFAAGDHRGLWPAEQRRRWTQAPRLFDEAIPRKGETLAQRALRFCLSYPAVSTVIPGSLTESQLEENVAASRLGPFPKEERRRFEEVYREHEFFIGSKRVVLSE